MAKPISHHILGFAGKALVVAVLGFIILPAFVVTVASFNDKAILSFPPQQLIAALVLQRDQLSGLPPRVSERHDRDARHLGHCADRRLRLRIRDRPLPVSRQERDRRHAAGAAGGAAFHGRPRDADLRRADRDDAHLHRGHRLPGHPGPAFRAAQRLYLAAQSRSAARTRRGKPRRKALARALHRDAAAADVRGLSAAGCSRPFCPSTNSPPRCS